MQATENTHRRTIAAPYTPAGEALPITRGQARMIDHLIHGDSLLSVDRVDPEWSLPHCLEVTLETGIYCMDADGTLTAL